MKNYLTSTLCFALAGCIATTDLLQDNTNLSSSHKKLLNEMAEKTKNICITYTYDPGTGAKLSGDMKISKLPVIKRFYTSDSGWFKVYFMINGVWDFSFYNPKDFKFVCGEKQWEKLKESRKISFDEVEVEVKNNSLPIISTQPKNLIIEDKLKNLKELRQKNLITEKQYDDLVKKVFE
jgi:hypothetical protein